MGARRAALGVRLPAGHGFPALRKLDELPGADFDEAYKALTLERHGEMARLLERAAARTADPGLRIFAERALPTVRKHLREASGIGL